MPYIGRAPVGVAGNIIEGDLKVTGTISGESINSKLGLDATDGSKSNINDHITIEAGGTDGSGTNANDDLLLEETTSGEAEGFPGLASSTSGQLFTSAGAGSTPTFTTVASGGYEFVSSTTASSSSTIDFAGLSGSNDYLCVLSNLKHSEDADLELRFGASTTYITANYQKAVLRNTQETVQAEANDGSGQGSITMTRGVTGGGATELITGYCEIFDLANSSFNTTAVFHLSGESNGAVEEQNIGAGRYEVNAALTDIRFFPSAGNFTSGTIRLYKRPSA